MDNLTFEFHLSSTFMIINLKKFVPLTFIMMNLFSLQIRVNAGTYKALCDEVSCAIVLNAKGITGPEGFMPAHRVVQWFQGGGPYVNKSAAAAGAGAGGIGGAVIGGIATCWTVVLCGPGIIAGGASGGISGSGLGKSSDFYFTIVGYNELGQKMIHSFNFINQRPVAKMMQELPIVSGLKMGSLRSIEEIKANDLILQKEHKSNSIEPTINLPSSIEPMLNTKQKKMTFQ